MQPTEGSIVSFMILVVDDEPPVCDLLTRIAQKAFPEATFTNTRSAPETLTYLAKTTKLPQLVLLDIDLKAESNGLALLPELIQRFQGKVPVIIFSMDGAKLTIEQAYHLGAVAYTVKPDNLAGWTDYLAVMRDYWYKTTRLPTNDSLN